MSNSTFQTNGTNLLEYTQLGTNHSLSGDALNCSHPEVLTMLEQAGCKVASMFSDLEITMTDPCVPGKASQLADCGRLINPVTCTALTEGWTLRCSGSVFSRHGCRHELAVQSMPHCCCQTEARHARDTGRSSQLRSCTYPLLSDSCDSREDDPQ
jgi:hypothetical protein